MKILKSNHPIKPSFEIENQHTNYVIAGIDEAGRGSLVGPVIAAAVILNRSKIIDGIDDSKRLSISKREYIYNQIISNHTYSIGSASVEEIDKFNILEATKLAMRRAFEGLSLKPQLLLIDGNATFNSDVRSITVVEGDKKSYSIAAASIIAKVSRDQLMQKISKNFPHYEWDKNKGYGTKKHMELILQHGPTPEHRQKFIRNIHNTQYELFNNFQSKTQE